MGSTILYTRITNSLIHIMDQPNLNMRQCRWPDVVKDYDCEILYLPGKANMVVDAQSSKLAGSSDGVSRMRILVDAPFLGLIRGSSRGYSGRELED